MTTFRIEGQHVLAGDIEVNGSKNSSTKILVATLLTQQECTIRNVPDIEDVRRILELLSSLGATVSWLEKHVVKIQAKDIKPERIDTASVRRLRASVLLFGALLGRCGQATLPGPGGDQIGSRPLDAHLDAFRGLGVHVVYTDDVYTLTPGRSGNVKLTMSELSVTATENAILASVLATDHTTIFCAAADPSVQDLCWFLTSLGAHIEGIGTHTLVIHGVNQLHGTDGYDVMPDPVETGTFICLAAASRSHLRIRGGSPDFLRTELLKFRDAGVHIEMSDVRPSPGQKYELADFVVTPTTELRALRTVHNMPFPGFNPDLLPPFTVLLTQASGTTLVHDWMYEGRLKYVEELNKMGADIFVADPHRILVTGPRNLNGSTITNYDIRTGASLLLASLIASGVSRVSPVYQLDRGYERIDKRLKSIGAVIQREEV